MVSLLFVNILKCLNLIPLMTHKYSYWKTYHIW
jgi:hypothetical protein